MVNLSCQRGGYTDPRKCDRCRCPDGFTGKLCEKTMPGYGDDERFFYNHEYFVTSFFSGANCGGEIAMTADYYYFNSPNYPRPFEEGQECSWLLKVCNYFKIHAKDISFTFYLQALPGEHVELEFIDRFELYCKLEHSLCMDYVEIRNTSDFANTGMRWQFAINFRPFPSRFMVDFFQILLLCFTVRKNIFFNNWHACIISIILSCWCGIQSESTI